ncbi:MAG: paraquat-inducible protein A [Desulfatirhabdiaceae bacterium]
MTEHLKSGRLIACHDCDRLYRLPAIQDGMTAVCSRCGAILAKPKRNSLDRTLALAIAGLILLLMANSFPFLGFKVQGQVRDTLLLTGIRQFYTEGMAGLAGLVFFTTILAPLIQFVALIYVLLPLTVHRRAPGMFHVFRWLRQIQPWSMMEVFMVGVLISIVKLAKMAEIIPNVAVFCFMALIFVMAACLSSLDPHEVWEHWEQS